MYDLYDIWYDISVAQKTKNFELQPGPHICHAWPLPNYESVIKNP